MPSHRISDRTYTPANHNPKGQMAYSFWKGKITTRSFYTGDFYVLKKEKYEYKSAIHRVIIITIL
jgi:hypothetical protein